MPQARKTLINIQDTPYYHCVSRCVRRAFLCGKDEVTGASYEHRRKWVENRLHLLAAVFAIDVCAYAVMSNHTHVVLHINQDKANSWDTQEIIIRWHRIHKGTLLTQQYLDPEQRENMCSVTVRTVKETAEIWRQRLHDISWFMRSLNEFIAKEANKEDKCTGRFWEGRFKSQALLDEAALAACMAYVDLNPVRAKMATTPETSKYTSIQYRINAAKAGKTSQQLMPFAGTPIKEVPKGLPFELTDYLNLVDITGRHIVQQKRGSINDQLTSILERLNLNTRQWQELTTSFETCFYSAAGRETGLLTYQQNHNLRHIKGRQNARRLFGSP